MVSFGAFVELDNGIEALLHISEISEPPPQRVEDVLNPGDHVVARIINLGPRRQRMGLSIKGLTDADRERYYRRKREQESRGEDDDPLAEEPVAEATQSRCDDLSAAVACVNLKLFVGRR